MSHGPVVRLRDFFGPACSHPLLAPHQNAALIQILARIAEFGGTILADDVGMGKSWVAAAVAAEFARTQIETELFVPAALQGQWRLLLRRFDLRAALHSHDFLVRHVQHGDPSSPKLIVVDEAHRFRNRLTQRYRSLARRVIGQKLLLVTATPICNSPDDLLALLQLFAPDDLLRLHGLVSLRAVFDDGETHTMQEVVSRLLIRRTTEDLLPGLRFGSVERRIVRCSVLPTSDAIAALIGQLRFPAIVEPQHRALLRSLLWYRWQSSVDALRDSLVRQRRFYRALAESSFQGVIFSKRDYRRLFADSDEELPVQSLLFPGLWVGARGAAGAESEEISRECAVLDDLLVAVRSAEDTKLVALREVLTREHCPAVIFTAAFATARALFRSLSAEHRCGLLTSHSSRLIRQGRLPASSVLSAFRRGEVDVLVATDIGAEGLDLQTARTVVHYDLPWNPVRLDQRNGRVNRIGQTRAVVPAFYFLPPRNGAGGIDVMRVLARKNRNRRAILVQSSERAVPTALRWQRIIDEALCSEDFNGLPSPHLWAVDVSAGFEKSSQLVADLGAGYVDAVQAIEPLFNDSSANGRTCEAGVGAQRSFDPEAWKSILRTRLVVPPSIPEGGVRRTWRRSLENLRAWNRDWSALLASSFPAGAELILEQYSQSALDSQSAARMATLLSGIRRFSELSVEVEVRPFE
ncbi:MAG: DEAD/DEAH box helicase [Acidobacteriota bacterium]